MGHRDILNLVVFATRALLLVREILRFNFFKSKQIGFLKQYTEKIGGILMRETIYHLLTEDAT